MQIRGVDRTSTDRRYSRSFAGEFDGREATVGDEVTRSDTGDLFGQEYAKESRQEELQSTFQQRSGGMRVLGRKCGESG